MEYSFTFRKTEGNLFILKKMIMAVSNSLYDWLLSYHVETPLIADVVGGSLKALDTTIKKMSLGKKCLFKIILEEKVILVRILIGNKDEMVKNHRNKDKLLIKHFEETEKTQQDAHKQKKLYSKNGIRLLYKMLIERRK